MISIWEKETFFAPQDVIIIGSGFVGLWCAFYLKKRAPDLKITIIERGVIPTGASNRNAGFACFGSLSELIADETQMGTDKMLQLVDMRYKGLLRIQKYFPDSKIDFERCGGYELYDEKDRMSKNELEAGVDRINSLLHPITGNKRTFRFDDEHIHLFGFGETSHLIKNGLEGSLHSGKLLQSLLQHVHSKGVQVLNNIEVKSFHPNENVIELKTNFSTSFSCKQLLICTNAYAKELLPETDIIPARGQILLTSPIQGLPWKGTFHSDQGYYYFRNFGNRVLLGGARNKAFAEEQTTELKTTELIQSELERYLEDVVLPRFKKQYVIEHRWSGIMAMGSEKMPIIQQLMPGVFCAIRMSGMGVALAPMVGKIMAKMMASEQEPFS
ncbi:FAD-binding oxidoreductase [Chitinophagaceae bacterium LB-8]|uniref:FAD-binding oxidoreductase n=1 Tax=Paraflavisolibacter caeni TaxID=2982496 RepID=A0A9X3BI68_9BACT|nr:FAD-dependent oxidoreductase [Paraflavisolibacter caeni]MCU7550807.1 FAD-binding oxidoreductase [Paraflavisolibacter caeni]